MAIENLLIGSLQLGNKINNKINQNTQDKYNRPTHDSNGKYIEKRYRSSSSSIPGSYISGFMNKR